MTRTRRFSVVSAFAAVLAIVSSAAAQTATVEVTHDQPSAIVSPGTSVSLTVRLRWTGDLLVHQIVGDAVATDDLGSAGAQSFHPGAPTYPPLTTINLGSPRAGSIVGVNIISGLHPGAPNMPIGYQPWVGAFVGGATIGDLIVLQYQWQAPAAAGVVRFDWNPSGDPLFYRLLPLPPSLMPASVPTSYLGASLVVLPAPPGLTLLACAGAAVRRRPRSERPTPTGS